MYKTTEELERFVNEVYDRLAPLAKRDNIYVPLDVVFGAELSPDYEGFHCYTERTGYRHCYTERGEVKIKNSTSSLFDITYWLIKDRITMMASKYKSQFEIPGCDLRRLMFSKELELFQELGGNYKRRAEIDIEEILKEHPFED